MSSEGQHPPDLWPGLSQSPLGPVKRRPCSYLPREPQLLDPSSGFSLPFPFPHTRLTPPLAHAETAYVLGNYKTEPCKKPPRLCRQGYACPYYHSSKDRRRSPRKHKYRSSPRQGRRGGRVAGMGPAGAASTVLPESARIRDKGLARRAGREPAWVLPA